MKSILYELYRGELCPALKDDTVLAEHQDFLKTKKAYYNKVKKTLATVSPELKIAFDDFMEHHLEEDFFDEAEKFIDGLCLAMQIMLEAQQRQVVKNF